ncbi:ScaC autotransporter protein [Orientia tsutsugamushi]|nr:autotransporter beta-domain protein [Orientia tsutsugamushi str. TA763]SPP24989.1 ScaC autotransporter protein [Orientia tsutsugamushi]
MCQSNLSFQIFMHHLVKALLIFLITVFTICAAKSITPEKGKYPQAEDIHKEDEEDEEEIADNDLLNVVSNMNLDISNMGEAREGLRKDIAEVSKLLYMLEQSTASSKDLTMRLQQANTRENEQSNYTGLLITEIESINKENDYLQQKNNQLKIKLQQLEVKVEQALARNTDLRQILPKPQAEMDNLRKQNEQLKMQLQQLQLKLQNLISLQNKDSNSVLINRAKLNYISNVKYIALANIVIVKALAGTFSDKLSKSHRIKKHCHITSSGSNIDKYWNGWVEPSFINTHQQEYGKIQEHSAIVNGILVGVNKYLNDRIAIGIIASYLKLDAQYASNVLRKTKCRVYSLYFGSRYYFQKNLFTQGIIGFANYDGKNKYKHIYKQPSAKIDNISYYGNLMIGFHFTNQRQLNLEPSIGISCIYFDMKSYKPSNDKILESIIGATIKYQIIYNISNATEIVTELSGFINYNILDNYDYMYKTYYQLGAKININYDMIKLAVSYNAYLTEKYIAHAGTIHIGTNF